jgi:hypothetical protein
MNQTAEKILRTTWTEPRHFFFWMALLSLAGFAGIVAGTGLTGANSLLALLAVCCGLCFVPSVILYVLAWIPPLRRLLGRLLTHRFLAVGCLVTLVALFYAVENWRGRSAWQSFKRQREAQGAQLTLANLIPPPVSEEQNFFNTPLWNDLHYVRANDRVIWSDTNWGNHVMFAAFGPGNGNAPSTGNWAKFQRVDLGAWQVFYRGTNNLFASPGGAPTTYFPVAKEPQTPAADVLLALSKFSENRQILTAAADRPQARFWIDYDAGEAMLLPHLSRIKAAIQYLSLHANAALKAGETQTALQDLRLQFRLLESVRTEPILISHLVRIAGLQIALQSVWEGLADQQWSEKDLRFLQSQLDGMDFLADYRAAMRGELACQLWAVDYVHKEGLGAWEQLAGSDREGSASDELMRFLGKGVFQLIPSGWFDQSKLSVCRIHDEFVLSAVDQKGGVVSPSRVKQCEFAFGERHWGLYDTFAKTLLPAYGRAIERFARAQASLELARLGCALERYRLANGRFPETLEALAPRFIEKVPTDVINGGSLKYQRGGDDQFTLYSVGWNERDDGGQIALTRGGSQDPNQGDWVWRYSAG